MPKYLGYAHLVEYPPGSEVMYAQGDNIPNMTKKGLAEMRARGHIFEGDEDLVPDEPENLPEPATNMSPNASSDADAALAEQERRNADALVPSTARVTDQHTEVDTESNVDHSGHPHTPGTPMPDAGGNAGHGPDPEPGPEAADATPTQPAQEMAPPPAELNPERINAGRSGKRP